MITSAPGATDVCLCGHAGAKHDATTQVCRFQAHPADPCGCVSFGVPGNLGNRPPVTNAPALSGNRNS